MFIYSEPTIKGDIANGVYINMRTTLIAAKEGLSIGENTIIDVSTLVNKDILSNIIAVGVPAKVIKEN